MHKKIQYILLLMLFTCLIPVTAKNKSRISLNDEWQFKQSISQSWLPAQVPGAVHTDLMNNRMIKDPFYGVNEKSLQWIGEKDWDANGKIIKGEQVCGCGLLIFFCKPNLISSQEIQIKKVGAV